MKRDEYLADEHVAKFTNFAGQLVTGELRLEHQWNSRGTRFRCTTLYEALPQYRWLDNSKGIDFRMTAQRLQQFRDTFQDIGRVDSQAKQERFIANVERIMEWGGISRPPNGLNDWRRMHPEKLQSLTEEIRAKLNPQAADTADLGEFRYMGAGLSKVYSLLVEGFPIYDSRVACALGCMVRIYCKEQGFGRIPDLLRFRMPPSRRPKNEIYHWCGYPRMNNNPVGYAQDNLKAAWLLQEMVRDPGMFGCVPGVAPIDALQSALFMVGYAQLSDTAISPADGRGSEGSREIAEVQAEEDYGTVSGNSHGNARPDEDSRTDSDSADHDGSSEIPNDGCGDGGFDIGNIIRDWVYEEQALWTPGRGRSRAGRVRFYVSELRHDWLKFDKITWRVLFRHLEHAMSGLREAGGDMKIGGTHGWAESGTFCRLLQEARGNSGMDSSYVVPLLVECRLLEYVWIDRVWGVRAIDLVP